MACYLVICRIGHAQVLECEQGRDGCNADDCNNLFVRRSWCQKHKAMILHEFESQFRKPIIRLEAKK